MISIQVKPEDERRIELHLEELPSRLMTRMKPVITELTNELLRRIHAAEPVRTGRLRQSTQAFVDEHPDRITGRVRVVTGRGLGAVRGSTHEAYAALEYGAHRSFVVHQHEEHLSHVFRRRADNHLVMVQAYTRRANITAQRFMRGPATAMRARVLAEFQRVIDEEAKL